MISASLSWRHLKILHFEETIKGTSTDMYAWHQGTPNGPIQSFAVLVIHKWRVPKIREWGLLQKELSHWAMSWELSTSMPAEASLGHTQEDVTPHRREVAFEAEHSEERCFLPERQWGQRKKELRLPLLDSVFPTWSPENNSRRKCPILFPFLQGTILQQFRKSLLNVINLKEKIVKNTRELLVKWQARCIVSPLEK